MKYLKWFIISSFLILFLGFCDVVSALDMTSQGSLNNYITGYDVIQQGYFVKRNLNFATSFDVYYDFSGNNNIQGYDYFQMPFLIQYTIQDTYNETGTSTSNVKDLECVYVQQQTQTYADGSTSTYYICGTWSSVQYPRENINIGGSIDRTPNFTLQVDLIFNNNIVSPCELNSTDYGSTYMQCKIPDNATTFSRIRFRNVGYSNTSGTLGQIGVGNYYVKWKDPIKSVITEQEETNNQLQDMNDNITSTDISGASQDQSNIVNNPAFQDNTGLSGIITAPLSMISSLTSQCQPIQLTLPYLKDTNVSIPCMGTFLQSKVPTLVTLIKLFVNGFICYLIGLDLFKIVKNARDPDNDRIEVLDL